MAGKSGAKGYALEEVLKAYFWQAGYFVQRGVPYRLDGDDVTDIDVWLYERPVALTRRRLIVDAKSKRSPKAAERIIWTSGLQRALGVDGSIVATTDNRPSVRRLAKQLGVSMLDGEALSRLVKSGKFDGSGGLSNDEFDANVKQVDTARRSTALRDALYKARASLLSGLGIQSANTNLASAQVFGEHAIASQPNSPQAQTAVRLFYLAASLAAVSLDYAMADQAFRPHEERRQYLLQGIRYGAEPAGGVSPLRAGIALARQFAENGAAVSKQIELAFQKAADRIPAEIIADYAARVGTSDALFNVARELEWESTRTDLKGFDHLSTPAKSFLGVVADFNGLSRERLAKAWLGEGRAEPAGVAEPMELGLTFPGDL